MAEINTNTISSGDKYDMQLSVEHAQLNKLLLDNISTIYKYKNNIQLPMHFLRKYENILKTNLVEIPLERNMWYKPEYVSYQVFNTTDLWYLILFINDMQTPMDLCTDTIFIPNSMYSMEILNKLKTIEKKVNDSHKNPIELERHLLKDLNAPSENIINISNDFRDKTVYTFEDALDTLITYNQYFYCIQYDPTKVRVEDGPETIFPNMYSSYITKHETETDEDNNIIRDEDVKYSFVSLPDNSQYINNITDDILSMTQYLNNNLQYVLFKQYNGDGLFYLTSINNPSYYKNLNNVRGITDSVIFDKIIMTYDLREASLLPEYFTQNFSITIYNKTYDTQFNTTYDKWGIYIDSNDLPTYKDSKGEYYQVDEQHAGFNEILLDDKCSKYYITLKINRFDSDGLIKKDENGEEISFEEDWYLDKKAYETWNELEALHSNETWVNKDINGEGSTLNPKLASDLSNSTILTFNKDFGNYILSKKLENITKDSEELEKGCLFQFKFNLERDLNTNKININNYQFLGFEVYYYLQRNKDFSEVDRIPVCPMSITYEYEEYDDNGDKQTIIKSFSLPYDYDTDLYDTENVKCIKRILPIIYDCSSQQRIDLKNIYISCRYDVTKCENLYFEEDNIHSFIDFGIAGIKISGFTYEEVIKDFNIYGYESDIYTMNYKYEYKDKYHGPYFEPFIFSKDDNLLEILDDKFSLNNENYTSYSIKTYREWLLYYEVTNKYFYIMNNSLTQTRFDSLYGFLRKDHPNYIKMHEKISNTVNKDHYLRKSITHWMLKNFYLDYTFELEFEVTFIEHTLDKQQYYNQSNFFVNNPEQIDYHIDWENTLDYISYNLSTIINIGNGTKYIIHIGDKQNENNKTTLLNKYKDTDYQVLPSGLFLETENGVEKIQQFKDIPTLNFNVHPINIKTIEDLSFNTDRITTIYSTDSLNEGSPVRTDPLIRIKIRKINKNLEVYYSLSINRTETGCDWTEYKLLYFVNDYLFPYTEEQYNNLDNDKKMTLEFKTYSGENIHIKFLQYNIGVKN